MKKLYPLAVALALVACKKELVCPQDQVDCGGRCVSLLTDSANCGACGTTCGALEACAAGSCGCAPGVAACDGACTDLTRDPANCGTCGNACLDATPYCLAGPAAACSDTCADGRTSCGGACVTLATDRLHCGGCDVACAPGETCRDGACGFPEVFVACFNTTEVIPVAADLSPAGMSRPVPGGPIALAAWGDAMYSANNWPSAGVSRIPLEARKLVTTTPLTATNQDVQSVTRVGDLLVATNADSGTLVFLDAKGRVVDELALPDQQSYPNPKELAVVGDMAYVALSGSGPTNGQKLARVDLSGVATCKTTGRCGALAGTIDVLALPGTADEGGVPFPVNVLAVDGRVFVTLTNLGEECGQYGCFYAKPAGSGKLLVVDPANGDATTVVDLGAGCANPSGLAAHGETLWVSCGAVFYPDVAPGAMVTIDLTQPTLAVSEPIALAPFVPGKVAFCGGVGYVGDQGTGDVRRFDPAARTFEDPLAVCPTGPYGYTTVSDVACAP
jgi:sugar lactone lactonase YvrE